MRTTIIQRVGDRVLLGLDRVMGLAVATGRLVPLVVWGLATGVAVAAMWAYAGFLVGGMIFIVAGLFGGIVEMLVNIFLPEGAELQGQLMLTFGLGALAVQGVPAALQSTFCQSVRKSGWRRSLGQIWQQMVSGLEPCRDAISRFSFARAAAFGINQTGRALIAQDLRDLAQERRDYDLEHRRKNHPIGILGDPARPQVDLSPRFGIEPFFGWRDWKVHANEHGDLFLLAVGVAYRWPGSRVEAACVIDYDDDHPHRAPDVNCRCGIYAVKVPELLGEPWTRTSARGRVRMWGRVIETEKGFRAEIAQIEGPVELILGCHGIGGRCPLPAEGAVGFDLFCRAHRPGHGLRKEQSIDRFIAEAAEQLEKRYGVRFFVKGR